MRQRGSLAGDPEKGIRKRKESDIIVALAGNPNVGKSTVFNAMTGLKQHTGNWPGKTVAGAEGYCVKDGQGYVMVDLPGCYSLRAHSKEEEVAGDFIRSGKADVVVVVCDAVCLERNLNLTLQIMDETPHVILCVNLMDEAAKKQIHIDLGALREQLKTPVVGIVARDGKGLEKLYLAIKAEAFKGKEEKKAEVSGRKTEEKVAEVSGRKKEEKAGKESGQNTEEKAIRENRQGIGKKAVQRTPEAYVKRAEEICRSAVCFENASYAEGDRKKDRIFTGKYTAFPIMFLLLLFIFWLTAVGANYPSELLHGGLFYLEDRLLELCVCIGLPEAVREMLVHGVYRVMAWVVSVMLPPMAIFFPLFTVLEDSGYLPRVAFNLDRCFKKCRACGKQALTMCMGVVILQSILK